MFLKSVVRRKKSVVLSKALLFQEFYDTFMLEGGGNTMKKTNKIFAKVINKAVEKTLTADANRTSCSIIYQPKAPAKLEKFKKSATNDN